MDKKLILEKAYHATDFTKDIKSVSNTGVFLTPIQKIPPEVWHHVFGNLEESIDLLNVSNAVNRWYEILHSTKHTWLFVQMFPFLLEYLSKQDVFVCRLVCQKWCYAVNNFLTQNSFHRPASSEPKPQLMGNTTNKFKTDSRIYPIDLLLRQLDLRYNPVKRLKEIATMSSISPDNATIVGKSAIVSEDRKNLRNPMDQNTNMQFLQRFGHQIQFLRINLDTLAYFFNVIQYLPNLKKLDFVYFNPCLTREQVNQEISNLMSTRPISEIKSILPKHLETLRIYMMKDDQFGIPQLLISLLADKVESLLLTAAIPPPIQKTPSRLVDLYIVIRENRHWDFFNGLLKCTIRRLLLSINGSHVNIKPMQIVLSNFKNSLRNLELHFTEESRELVYHTNHYLFFAKERLRLPNVFRLTFKDNIPLSFNFISSLKSLQYLHFFVGRYAKGEVNKALNAVSKRLIRGEEELDLLKLLFGILAGAEEQVDWGCALKYLGKNIKSLYESNIWNMFPKLRVVTVLLMVRVNGKQNDSQKFSCYEKTKEYELRRDIYEKFQDGKLQ